MRHIGTNAGTRAGAVYHYYRDGSVYYRLAVYYYPLYMCDAPDGCRHGYEIHAVESDRGDRLSVVGIEDAIAHGDCELVDYADDRNARYMARQIRATLTRRAVFPVERMPRIYPVVK